MTLTQREEQQSKIITVTECPTEPCTVYYTDALSQSVLVICRNRKHADAEKRKAGESSASNLNRWPEDAAYTATTRLGDYYHEK